MNLPICSSYVNITRTLKRCIMDIKNSLLNYYKDNNLLDKKMIESLFEYFIKETDTAKFLNSVELAEEKGGPIAYLDNCYHYVYLNLLYLERLKKYSFCADDLNKDIYLKNNHILHIIIHELMHAKQLKLYSESGLIHEIVIDSRFYTGIMKKAYSDHHDDFIIEWNADVEAYFEIIKLLKSMDIFQGENMDDFIDRIRGGYETSANYPLQKEVKITTNETELIGLDEINTYNKIIYGLPDRKSVV